MLDDNGMKYGTPSLRLVLATRDEYLIGNLGNSTLIPCFGFGERIKIVLL